MSQRWGLLRRRARWFAAFASVAVAITVVNPTDGEATTATVPLLVGGADGLSIDDLAFRDGDHVVFDAGHDGHADHAEAKAGAGPDGGWYHDGFSTYGDARLGDHYEIRLVRSRGVEDLRPHVTEAVAHAAAATGVPLTVLPGTVAPTGPSRGQIDIVVSSRSPCRGSWLGCGGPAIDDGRVRSGIIWINPRVFERPVHELANTVRHELGHTLGLGHYEYLHEDRVQSMHPSRFDAAGYEAGDLAGLRFVGGDRTGSPAPAPAPDPLPAVDPEGALDDAVGGPFGVVVRGWAFDREASGPVTVTVTVDGRAHDVVADEPLTLPDGTTRAWAFRATRVAGPGVHEVCATARNVGGGADTPLGCVAVRVRPPSVGLLGLQTF